MSHPQVNSGWVISSCLVDIWHLGRKLRAGESGTTLLWYPMMFSGMPLANCLLKSSWGSAGAPLPRALALTLLGSATDARKVNCRWGHHFVAQTSSKPMGLCHLLLTSSTWCLPRLWPERLSVVEGLPGPANKPESLVSWCSLWMILTLLYYDPSHNRTTLIYSNIILYWVTTTQRQLPPAKKRKKKRRTAD